jgi:hypothetical protein
MPTNVRLLMLSGQRRPSIGYRNWLSQTNSGNRIHADHEALCHKLRVTQVQALRRSAASPHCHGKRTKQRNMNDNLLKLKENSKVGQGALVTPPAPESVALGARSRLVVQTEKLSLSSTPSLLFSGLIHSGLHFVTPGRTQ